MAAVTDPEESVRRFNMTAERNADYLGVLASTRAPIVGNAEWITLTVDDFYDVAQANPEGGTDFPEDSYFTAISCINTSGNILYLLLAEAESPTLSTDFAIPLQIGTTNVEWNGVTPTGPIKTISIYRPSDLDNFTLLAAIIANRAG